VVSSLVVVVVSLFVVVVLVLWVVVGVGVVVVVVCVLVFISHVQDGESILSSWVVEEEEGIPEWWCWWWCKTRTVAHTARATSTFVGSASARKAMSMRMWRLLSAGPSRVV